MEDGVLRIASGNQGRGCWADARGEASCSALGYSGINPASPALIAARGGCGKRPCHHDVAMMMISWEGRRRSKVEGGRVFDAISYE